LSSDLGAPTGLSEVRWTRTTVGGPNYLGGSVTAVIEHSLNVDPSFRPRKQRLRKMSDDKAEGARNEVKRLLSAGVIREVK
jgi:hypothetical protein